MQAVTFDHYDEPGAFDRGEEGGKKENGGGSGVPDLHKAALLNDFRTCDALIKAHADVHATDAAGRTGMERQVALACRAALSLLSVELLSFCPRSGL